MKSFVRFCLHRVIVFCMLTQRRKGGTKDTWHFQRCGQDPSHSEVRVPGPPFFPLFHLPPFHLPFPSLHLQPAAHTISHSKRFVCTYSHDPIPGHTILTVGMANPSSHTVIPGNDSPPFVPFYERNHHWVDSPWRPCPSRRRSGSSSWWPPIPTKMPPMNRPSANSSVTIRSADSSSCRVVRSDRHASPILIKACRHSPAHRHGCRVGSRHAARLCGQLPETTHLGCRAGRQPYLPHRC